MTAGETTWRAALKALYSFLFFRWDLERRWRRLNACIIPKTPLFLFNRVHPRLGVGIIWREVMAAVAGIVYRSWRDAGKAQGRGESEEA